MFAQAFFNRSLGYAAWLVQEPLTFKLYKVKRYCQTLTLVDNKWDTTRPNGTPRKLLDVSKATKLGWSYKTELEDGIRLAYKDFLENPMRAER